MADWQKIWNDFEDDFDKAEYGYDVRDAISKAIQTLAKNFIEADGLMVGGRVTDEDLSALDNGSTVSFNNAQSNRLLDIRVNTYASVSERPFNEALQGLLMTIASNGDNTALARKHQLFFARRKGHIYWRFTGLNPEDTTQYVWSDWRELATVEDVDAVREEFIAILSQIPEISSKLDSTADGLLKDGLFPREVVTGYYNKNGVHDTNANYQSVVSEFAVNPGEVYRYRGRGGDPNDPSSLPAAALFYSSDGTFLSAVQCVVSGYHEVTVPANAAKAIFASLRNVTTAQAEIFELDRVNSTYYAMKQLDKERIPSLERMNDRLTLDGEIPFNTIAGFFKANGTRDTNANYESLYSDLTVTTGEIYRYRGRGGGDAVSYLFFNSSGTVIETGQYTPSAYHDITVPENAVRGLFTSFRNINSAAQPRVFTLTKKGTMIDTVQRAVDGLAPAVAPQLTLNSMNRLYAAETMGQNRQVQTLDKAVVCIGFDDYNLDCLEAVQELNRRGMPSYLALIPDKVTDDWAMAKECYNGGGEICAHSSVELTSENQTFEMMNEKFIRIPEQIGAAGFPVYGIIMAGGTGLNPENKALDEFYCRAAGLKYSDYYGESAQYTLGRYNMTRKTLAQWEAFLDDLVTNKGYAILFCHHVNGTEKYSYPDGFDMDDFNVILDLISARDIDVMTINGFVDKYVYGIDPTDGFVRGT